MVKIGFKGLRGAIGWKTEDVGLFKGESVVKIEACGGGSEMFAWLSCKALCREEVGCRTDLSGERPLAVDIGGLKITFLLKGRPMYDFSSEKTELIKPQEDSDGISAVPEAELGSWKISMRRVDAIDYQDESYLQYQDLVLDAVRRVNISCRSSRMDVVVVSEYADCGCSKISGPLRLRLGWGLEWKQKRRGSEGNRRVDLNVKGRQLLYFRIVEREGLRILCEKWCCGELSGKRV